MPRFSIPTFHTLMIVAASIAFAAAVSAQPAPPIVRVEPPANEGAPPPNGDNGSKDTELRTDAPLSQKLKESEGVIEPSPGADPDIQKPTPETGSKMPVITPPGESGGDPNVQTK